jgi:transposase
MPSVAREKELNDGLWERVRPLLPSHPPGPRGGRPRADDRECFEGIVYVLRNGVRWRDLPDRFPSPSTVWRRHAAWTEDGVWEDVWRVVLDELADAGRLDTSELYLDATFAAAQKGGSRSGTPSAARG